MTSVSQSIALTVNGLPVEVASNELRTTLLELLRETLHLTGTKNGCSQGHCGACTVIVNGWARRSCLVRMENLAGAQVETIESLVVDDRLHPLQQAFVEEGAIQCGFCTPGMLMAAKALLDRNPEPSDVEIRNALGDNLCRCTGYAAVLRAVKAAAVAMKGQALRGQAPVEAAEWDVIGESVVRKDAWSKVTGRLKYADDLFVDGMLHARALRSEFPHARILAVDVDEAKCVPGVVRVCTADDIPGKNLFGLIEADQPVLAGDRVRFVGDAIACVYAESISAAEAALARISVRYEPLEVVSTPQRALEPTAPLIHEGGNILAEHHVRKGDVDAGFLEAHLVVENEYYTPFVEHAYLEPEACLAEPDGAGGVRVHIGSQGPNVDRKQVAESLGLPMERVRVIHTPMGGGFGGKEDITVQILAALGAMLTGRPVKMVLPRSESMRISTKRHAMYMRYKSGVSADGRLVAVQARIVGDTGAYGSVGSAVLFRAATFGCGPYVVPNVCVDSYAVYTNNPPCGAMRGFGSPQVAFAADCQMDEIARRLGMDPFEVRLRNALEPGSITATGHRVVESVGVKDCLLAVRRELAREALPEPSAGRRLGVGISAAYKNVGLGPGVEDQAGARMELTPAGKVVVRCGCVDMGQGHDTAMAQIASRTLQVPYCDIMVVTGDTESCPDSYMTTASRATLLQGRAVQMAAERLRECVLDYAVSQYDFRREKSRWLGDVVRDESTGSSVALRELAAKAAGQGYALQAEAYYRAPKAYYNFVFDEERFAEDPEQYRVHVAYCFCAQACVVEVDEATGEVKVLRIIAAQDVGTPIHPQNLQGQMEGGVVMGMGYGLTEEFMVRDGYVVSDTLRKSKIPRITDAPAITTLIVENPHSLGPYGAKGMAELSLASTAPAIANGVFDAVGVRVRQLPLTRERVLAALQQSGPGVSAH